MSKKKFDPQETKTIQEAAAPAPVVAEAKVIQEEIPLYSNENWKQVKTVFKCNQCGQYRNTFDEIALHIVSHYPEDKRDVILTKLIGEK